MGVDKVVKKVTLFEKRIYDSLVDNAFLFFKEGFVRLLDRDKYKTGKIDTSLLTLTCAELQIALELAMRAILVKSAGVKSILKGNQSQLSDEKIEELYINNAIKVTEFDTEKNCIKTHNLSRLSKEDFKTIDRFQQYRNNVVHFTCDFSDEQLNTLRDGVLYYIVHVLLVLLADTTTGETPSEYLQSKLGYEFYKRVMDYPPYVKAMEQYAAKESDPIWTCVGCSHRAYSPEFDYCFICGYESITGYSRVDCYRCGTKHSVIYDNLDIHNEGNHHQMTGFCMNCERHTTVYECPICGEAHDVLFEGDFCHEGYCAHQDDIKS